MKKQIKRPVKRVAYKTSPHLHVTHHKHTGHILPRRTTSYPTLVMIMLVLGVFLVSWTRFVTADSFVYPGPKSDSYIVHASVPGPPPSVAATIESPDEGTVFTSVPITVKGSCPINTYETLYRNGAFSGVALCDLAGAYEIQTGLFPGANKLEVRDFSLTDVAGPMSNAVNVTYNPPTPPPTIGSTGSTTDTTPTPSGQSQASGNSSSTTNTSGQVVRGEPLIFKTSFSYQGHYIGNTSTWQLDIEGGAAPYAISVDWGDGSHSLISRATAGAFLTEHVYKQVGGYRGSYVTKFTASDADNTQTFLQLLAIVNNPPTGSDGQQSGTTGNSTKSGGVSTIGGSAATGATNNSNSNGVTKTSEYVLTLVKYVWPSYGFAVLMLFSFWLGERREYQHLRPRLQPKKHRHRHA